MSLSDPGNLSGPLNFQTLANSNRAFYGDTSGGAGIFTSIVNSGTSTLTGAVTAGSTIVASGAVSGASIAATGAVTGASVAATGAVTGASVAATGAVTGASVAATGAVTGATVAATGNITASGFKITPVEGSGSSRLNLSPSLLTPTVFTSKCIYAFIPTPGATGFGVFTNVNLNADTMILVTLANGNGYASYNRDPTTGIFTVYFNLESAPSVPAGWTGAALNIIAINPV
jgi:hypothetical protein